MNFLKRLFLTAAILSTLISPARAGEPSIESTLGYDPIDFTFGEREAMHILQVNSLLAYANSFYGVPYRYGASSPKGFDCSGFTSYVFKEFGYKLNRTAGGQFSNGTPVKRDSLRPGDLVFFGGRGNGSGIGHVGIVVKVDDNKHDFTFIHASCNKGITHNHSSETYYRQRYRTACRIL